MAAAGWLAPLAGAQDLPVDGGGRASEVGEAPAPLLPGQEVRVDVETFGVGGLIRPGDLGGLRLALTDTGDRPRDVAVRLELRDADGDEALYTRVVTLTPGRALGVWLYARMPWDLRPGGLLRVGVYRATTLEDGSVEIGRQLGAARVTPERVAEESQALAAVIGRGSAGLDQYSQTLRDRPYSPAAHEILAVAGGLLPEALPDSWMGWAPFEVVVWSEGEPSAIEGRRAEALREWVHRGGHLVIVLPSVGSPWSGANNPLGDLLPRARIDRIAEADMTGYRRLLARTGPGREQVPLRGALHRFVIDADATPADASAVINGPDGCVVARRLVGTGMVSVVGLDVTGRALSAALEADAFWGRVLGRRQDVLTQAEMETAGQQVSLLRAFAREFAVDGQVAPSISKGRVASVGVLLAVVVFAGYWLLAGPLGFAALKARGGERHAWVLFVGVAGIFTLVAWVGAGAMRPKREQVWHYTFLDHVYGQPGQRARTFLSVLLPQYGEQTVSIGVDNADESWHQALTPWSASRESSAQAFPDARGYEADVRRLDALRVPARSTIKQFQADWYGGPRWTMPGPTTPAQAPTVVGSPGPGGPSGGLSGELVHGLPSPLRDVQVILVLRQTPEDASDARLRGPGPLRAQAYAWTLDSWAPGETLSLSSFKPDKSAEATELLSRLVPSLEPGLLPGSILEVSDPADAESLAALFPVLEQPDYRAAPALTGGGHGVVRRRMVHTLDLARWFTQPCLIVLGAVEDAPCPIPVAVDGRPLTTGPEAPTSGGGRTAVRWVYPLRPEPVIYGRGGAGPATSTPRGDAG